LLLLFLPAPASDAQPLLLPLLLLLLLLPQALLLPPALLLLQLTNSCAAAATTTKTYIAHLHRTVHPPPSPLPPTLSSSREHTHQNPKTPSLAWLL
jgi:hypothetical protein